MSALLFRLRNVPDDEAEDVRNILDNNNLEYYETSAGNWGISTAAIWLKDKEQLNFAKKLIDEYQFERGSTQRQSYEEEKKLGRHKTLLDSFYENPFRFIAYLTIIGFILYVSIKPFLAISQ